MSILINKDTRVITQGITGKTGQFHTRMCRDYANGKNCFVAGVNPKKAGEDFEGIPIYASVQDAKAATGATVSVIYVPPAGAAAAILEAVQADLDLAICITEGIPIKDMLEVRNQMKAKEAAGGKKTLLLGPNCPGTITPDEIKIGIMPGHIHKAGRVGVVSRSGTLTYEAVAQLTELGIGQSSAVGIGGDPINGLKHIDVMQLFNDDPDTDAVIMIGEIGGPDEADAARWCKANMKKPIVGFIAGVTAPPGKRMGHAGALISGGADTADAKLAIMEECGFTITRNPSEMGRLLQGTHGDIGLAAHRALLHVAAAGADIAQNGAQLGQIVVRFVGAVEIGFGDDLQQRHARTVVVQQAVRRAIAADMDRFAGILLQVGAAQANDLWPAVSARDGEAAADAQRQFVLADLIALGQIGIAVVFAGKNRRFGNLRAQGQTGANGLLDGPLIDDRQYARHSQADRANV